MFYPPGISIAKYWWLLPLQIINEDPYSSDSEIDDQVAALSKKFGPTAWVCTDCGKQASQRTDLKKHIEAAHLNLYLPCDLCGTVFKTRHHRQNHMRTAHGMTSKY